MKSSLATYVYTQNVHTQNVHTQNLGAYIISVTIKTTLCILAKMCATNGGATARSLDKRC